MLRLLCDENLNGDITSGLLLRRPTLDLVRVQDVGLLGAEDPDVLAWAALDDLVSHDRATLPSYAFERVARGDPMPGVFIISNRLAVRVAIDELSLIDECTESADWRGL